MEIEPLLEAESSAALERIEHIVVLMLENRSFDHMLGYLRLAGREDVDGLRLEHSNIYNGRVYPVHRLTRTRLEPHEDPSHSGRSVDQQVAGGTMGGFVANFVETRKERRDEAELNELSPVMGYYDASDLQIYDELARHFCICDRWFASVAGATWPNRLYAVAGESEGRRDNKKLFGRFDFPFYFLPSFVRHLDKAEVSWRWYHAESFDITPPTLQLVDPRYLFRPGGNFALIESDEPLSGQASFLEDAAEGRLPAVAWLDPNFFGKRGVQNDDHPPVDVREAQELVRKVCRAIMDGPKWEQSLFVVTYDEHGGFFDHVAPPPAADDRANFRSYGVRIPAIVVSPWVLAESVSHVIFDHTSIIKTVLERFCDDGGRVPPMGARVDAANHLGVLLASDSARPPISLPELDRIGIEIAEEIAEDERVAALRFVSGEDLTDVAEALPTAANDLQLGLAAAAGEASASRSRANGSTETEGA